MATPFSYVRSESEILPIDRTPPVEDGDSTATATNDGSNNFVEDRNNNKNNHADESSTKTFKKANLPWQSKNTNDNTTTRNAAATTSTGGSRSSSSSHHESEETTGVSCDGSDYRSLMDANVQAFRTRSHRDDDDDANQPEMRVQDMQSPPSSLRQFFHEFQLEFQSLLEELVEYGRTKSWKKKILTVLLCVASVLVFYDLLFGEVIVSHLEQFVQWMTHHSASAVLAFVAIFVISTLIFIPPTLLIFGAGYAFAQAIGFGWGIVAATLSCGIGSCIGACIAFVRSRYMMRDLIYLFSKRYPLVRAADRALKRNGFRIMLLLRLCPFIPFNGLNYCCGITGVRLEDFALSLIGIVPFQIFTVVVGATTGTFALQANGGGGGKNSHEYNARQQLGFVVLIASGCAFGFLALVYTWKVVKEELRKELALTPQQFDECLHPAAAHEQEEQQGGMEHSIEVKYVTSPSDDEHPWMEEGEKWFWVWV